MKPGYDLQKPPTIFYAPNASAAFIVEGKTTDSVFWFLPVDINTNTRASESSVVNMKHNLEDVCVVFLD